MSKDRVAELETRVAFQEDALQALNRIIVDQQQSLSEMEKKLDLLAERYRGLKERVDDVGGQGGQPVDEKPPHY